MQYLVKLEDVSVKYRVGRSRSVFYTAISHVNLEISPREFVGIVGRSGCGKTTVLKVLAGLIKPDEGRVEFNNGLFRNGRPRIGMMFQSPLLLPWRTVMKNVLLPIEIMGEDPSKYLSRAKHLLERTGLSGFEDRYPWELSGGMQQRVALCRALIHSPEILLLDEPFGALDAITREDMWLLLESIYEQEEMTVVFVTHDVREAVFLSDRVVVMGGKPGTVKGEVEIPFDRPRQLDLQFTREFSDYVVKVKNMLGD